MIVPQAAGGGTDVFARALGQRLSERWGQPVIIDNRAGAAGVIGTGAVAKAEPDGYTLLFTLEGAQAINQTLFKTLTFHHVKDFQAVALMASVPFMMQANPKVPAKNLAEFITLAKQKPGTFTFATPGTGSISHLLGEMLQFEANIKLIHVPYRGTAQGTADLIGGQVDTNFGSVPAVIQSIKAGQLRALGVTSARRISVLPDVPTFSESGLPGFDVDPWWGILAPAGTDATIVNKINADVAAILKSKDMLDFLDAQSAQTRIVSPAEFQKILAADVEKWAKVINASGTKID
jgi:tripartite-type tricarboxylate transporter receptor subunit TctC